MRRSALCLCAAVVLFALCVPSAAVDLEEAGIQVRVLHDPLLSDGRLTLAVAVSGYCRLAVGDGWMVRAELGSLLDLFLPWIGISTSHVVGDRWMVEAQLAAQSDLRDSIYLTLSAGGRVLIAGSATSRLMLASFPLSLVGLWHFSPNDFALDVLVALNAALDFAWAASEHVILGQSFSLSVAGLGGLSSEMAFPLGEELGLILDSRTRVGVRP